MRFETTFLKTLPAYHRQKTHEDSTMFFPFAVSQCAEQGELSSGISGSGAKRSCSFSSNIAIQHINHLSSAFFHSGTAQVFRQTGMKHCQMLLIKRNASSDDGH